MTDESPDARIIDIEWDTAPAGWQRCELEIRSALLASNWAISHRGKPLRVRIEYSGGTWLCASVWSHEQRMLELERRVVGALMSCGLPVYA